MDPLFPDKVRAINAEDETTKDKLPILDCYFTTQPEWDPVGAGKNLPVAELLSRWVNTIQEYYAQEEVRMFKLYFFHYWSVLLYYTRIYRHTIYFVFIEQKIKPLLVSLARKQEHLDSKEGGLHQFQNALETDEQKLEMLQDEIEKIEQEKAQLSQDKETCRQKLDRGIKLLGTEWMSEIHEIVWNKFPY